MAKDIGRALGYGNDGQKLAQRVTQDWANEFIEENDFAVIRDGNLVAFKTLLEVIPGAGISRARHVLVLFESGVNLVCMKTNKPAGQHLRRWLASEVLPQLRETGSYEVGESRRDANAHRRLREDIKAAGERRREDIKTLAACRREALALLKDAWDFDLLSQAYVTRYVLHSVALVDGTEPPDGPRLIDVSSFLEGKGFDKETTRRFASRFGKKVRVLFEQKHGEPPRKVHRLVNGGERLVNSYTELDLPLFEEVFEQMFPVVDDRAALPLAS
jgi:prophage antirepressor-like protein